MATTIQIPNLLDNWPFPPTFNPHHEVITSASSEWIESYHAFDDRAQTSFNRCKFGFFAALAYPHAGPAHFRAACDLMNYFFVFDELSDAVDGESVRLQSKIIKDALSDPLKNRDSEESVLGAMAQDFWARALDFTSPSSARRFVKNFSEYTDAVAQEAEDRDHGRIRSVNEYLNLRRGTIGVLAHPRIEGLVLGAIDMTILANDVYSYNKEQSCGADTHNMVSVVMKEKRLDVQGAIDYIGGMYRGIAGNFVQEMKGIPSFPEPIDQLVSEYVFGLGNWVTTNIEWSFESERYFGKKGPEVKAKLVVELLPRRLGSSGELHNICIPKDSEDEIVQ